MQDVMLDLETLSTDSNGVIVSISAVQCNMETGEVGESIEIGLKIQEQLDKGAVIDGDTVMWWLSQPKSAQNELTRLYQHKVSVGLDTLSMFLKKVQCNALWGNSSTFDNVMLRNLYNRHGIRLEIPFWADRCVRTRVADRGINTKDVVFDGIKHRGIDDCLHQIKYCTGEADD